MRILAALLILACSAPLLAQESEPAAQGQELKSEALETPPELPEAAAPEESLELGAVFGPWTPAILSSKAYLDAQKHPALLKDLPAETRDPLLKEWDGIEQVKAALVAEAKPLDAADERLYSDALPLSRSKKLLDDWYRRLTSAWATHQSACHSGPLPPGPYKACLAQHNALAAESARYTAAAKQHNANVAAWVALRKRVKEQGEKLVVKTGEWEKRIAAFAAAAEEAESGENTLRLQAQGDDMRPMQSEVKTDRKPICLSDAEAMLERLKAKLTKPQLREREGAFEKALDYMRRAAAGGGLGFSSKSCYDDKRSVADARVDVEVRRGRALVNCNVGY